jgi:hypothetical protein
MLFVFSAPAEEGSERNAFPLAESCGSAFSSITVPKQPLPFFFVSILKFLEQQETCFCSHPVEVRKIFELVQVDTISDSRIHLSTSNKKSKEAAMLPCSIS